MRIKLVYNPTAGRGRARRHIEQAERCLRELGAEFHTEASRSPQDLTRIAGEASRDSSFERVVVCGGDGSLNLALRDFDLERGTLGLIPLGSGDDFAKVLEIPRSVRSACEIAMGDNIRSVDVALANGVRYLGVAGLGFDSEVARCANEQVTLLRGSLVYLWAIMRVLPRFRPRPVRINESDMEIMFAVFGNSRQYGAGIRITPDALIDDGKLDVVIIHRSSRMELLKTLPAAYGGKHLRSSFVESRRGETFRVESSAPMDVYADGELVTATPATFEIAPQRLRIAAPVVEK